MCFRNLLRLVTYLYLCTAGTLTLLNANESSSSQTEHRIYPPNYREALLLGVVEGVTEYLPISSTGHLILVNHYLKLDEPTPVYDKAGAPLFIKKNGTERPLTLQDAINAYSIVIQGGAIIAVVLLYWRRIVSILQGILGRNYEGLLLARNLIFAFLPAAVLGLLLDDIIEEKLFNPISVCIALVCGGLLMLGTEYWKKRCGKAQSKLELHELSISKSLMIGLLQCIAMWPGTSRSMMTIVGGYYAGLRPALAAEFSFLLGLITLSAASGYKALTAGKALLVLNTGPLLFGIVIATLSAAIAVKFLVHILTRYGLSAFAYYRIVLAGGILLALYY